MRLLSSSTLYDKPTKIYPRALPGHYWKTGGLIVGGTQTLRVLSFLRFIFLSLASFSLREWKALSESPHARFTRGLREKASSRKRRDFLWGQRELFRSLLAVPEISHCHIRLSLFEYSSIWIIVFIVFSFHFPLEYRDHRESRRITF